jgi:hypothetical protein
MAIKQGILDRIRLMNKYATNKLVIKIAGKRFGHFAILGHEGRKTGRVYKIPIIAEPLDHGFVIALTYGRKVDWCANVLAKGRCSLFWKNHEYFLNDPRFIDKEFGLKAFPPVFSAGLKLMGIQYFLSLSMVH